MLKIGKEIVLNGSSMIDGVTAEYYVARINDADPNNMTISSSQQDRNVYKENRATCREDRAAFEDAAYKLQDEMIAELAAKTEGVGTNGTKTDETV